VLIKKTNNAIVFDIITADGKMISKVSSIILSE